MVCLELVEGEPIMLAPSLIPVRSAVAPPFQASKWQKCPLLIDENEMRHLLTFLGEFWIVRTSGLIPSGREIIHREDFITIYGQYIHALQQGKLPSEDEFRPYFFSVFTADLEALYKVQVYDERCLVKVHQPVVQLQTHRFDYSFADGAFHSMVFGYESIYWGLQFSYPFLYQDTQGQVFKVTEDAQFPNTALFKKLQRWVRAETIATPFEVNGKQVRVPIRLGKQCLQWINRHPQLPSKGLRIVV
jgi:hypothetical protein